MKNPFMRALHRFAHHPGLNFLCGFVLLATGGYDAWETLSEMKPGVHHGAILLGIVQMLKALPELLEGAESLDDVMEGD